MPMWYIRKLRGMQAAVVLNLMARKGLAGFDEVNISEFFRLTMC